MKGEICCGCGKEIGWTTTADFPSEGRWLHYDWQHMYDHLPTPLTDRAETRPTTPRARECETGDNAEEIR